MLTTVTCQLANYALETLGERLVLLLELSEMCVENIVPW